MDLYLHFECFDFLVRSDLCDILEGVRLQFGSRASYGNKATSSTVLSCKVDEDREGFEELMGKIDFNGPNVEASKGISIAYAFCPPKTYMSITNTAIAELDETILGYAIIRLDPGFRSPRNSSQNPISGRPNPLPEAFLYPLMAEMVRDVGTCLLHCGCVMHEGRAVLLTGPPRSGKSTHVLRMVQRGAGFLADDLAIVGRGEGGLRIYPFREVANVHECTVERFGELARVRGCPHRGDNKYLVNIKEFCGQREIRSGIPAVVLRLNPDREPWIRRCHYPDTVRRIHNMGWFVSRASVSESHFSLLLDLLMSVPQFEVSQGYLAQHLDELMADLPDSFE